MVAPLVHLGVLRLPRDVAVVPEVGADEPDLQRDGHQRDGGDESRLRRTRHA